MRKLNTLLMVVFLFLLLSCFVISGQDYSGGSTQNVVDTVSAQIEPEPVEYASKGLDSGLGLYNPNGDLIARSFAPGSGEFILSENKDKITFKDNGAGQDAGTLDFGNFAEDQTMTVSNIDLFSEVTYNPNENTVLLNEKSTADIYADGTELKQITDAKVRMNQEGIIDYAEFTSKEGGAYTFYYNEKQYMVNANPGDKVVFDPENNKLSGSSTSGKEMRFTLDENLVDSEGVIGLSKQGTIKAKDFEVSLDQNGKIREVNLPYGGTYQDKENKFDYSSREHFSVFYDGKEIKNYEGNAISVIDNEEGLSIQAKGQVNVKDIEKELFYQGKSTRVYSEYFSDNSYFDVQNGEALVSNGKHQVSVSNGLAMNLDDLEYSGKEASAFSVGYSHDGTNPESLLVNYVETDGEFQTEAIYFKDGQENIIDLGNLRQEETRYLAKATLPTRGDIDRAILNLDANDPEYNKKLADLYATRGLMNEQETSNYKIGQEVFEVSKGHMRRLGKISQINEDGTFVLEGGYYYNVNDMGEVVGDSLIISKDQLDGLAVSKLGIGNEVGETSIKDVIYDSGNNQIRYLFESGQESSENQVILDYFSEDYKEAISFYQEAQKNPQLAGEATLSLASVYQQIGDTGAAKEQYMTLLRDSSLDSETRTQTYKGLIYNYFKEENPRTALYTSFRALQEIPDDVALGELKKQLTKSYLSTISSAIDTGNADVLSMWKERVDFGEKWYNVGLDQPIVSWFREDIDFATGFSRSQLNQQQKGILVMENLIDRGYSLKDVQTMDGNQIRDIFQIQSAEAVDMTNAIRTAFENSDIQNLANGGKYAFDFETGTGYVDKEFLEKGLAEKILSEVNTKNVAIFVAAEGVGYGVQALRGTQLAGSTASTGFWTKPRYVANIFQKGSTPYYVTKTLTSDVFLELPANLKQLSGHLQTQSIIKGLAGESGATLGSTTLANTRITSLDFDDISSVNGFLNKNVLGTADEGIRILTKDAKAGQYLLEMNGQQFLTRIAGQEVSSSLLLNNLAYPKMVNLISSGEETSQMVSAIFRDPTIGKNLPKVGVQIPKKPQEISLTALQRMTQIDEALKMSPEHMKTILIGVGDYDNVQKLTYTDHDVRGMIDYFRSQGIPESNILKIKDPDSTTFSRDLKQALEDIGPQDKATIYYSGHLIKVEEDPSFQESILRSIVSSKETGLKPGYYFALKETSLENGKGLVSVEEVGVMLKNKKGTTVILDACHSGGACETLSQTGPEEGLFIASTDANQLAAEIPELEQGIWTSSFLKSSKLEALSSSKGLEFDPSAVESFSDRIKFASETIPKLSASLSHDQQMRLFTKGISTPDSYSSGRYLLSSSTDDVLKVSDLKKQKFLFEAGNADLPVYSINQYGIEMDEKQLFGRRWGTSNPYKEWENIDELRSMGLSGDVQSYAELRDIANIGRAFNLESHMQGGKFVLYNAPAEGRYIWTLDVDGTMNIGLRLDTTGGPSAWQPSPYVYRSQGSYQDKILPHPALSGGNKVYGAGEVSFENGEVAEVNAWSGHYVDKVGSLEFNENAIESFKMYAQSMGLELTPDVRFITSSPNLN